MSNDLFCKVAGEKLEMWGRLFTINQSIRLLSLSPVVSIDSVLGSRRGQEVVGSASVLSGFTISAGRHGYS